MSPFPVSPSPLVDDRTLAYYVFLLLPTACFELNLPDAHTRAQSLGTNAQNKSHATSIDC